MERILALHKQLPESLGTPHEKTALASGLIEATDGQIDGGPAVRSDGGGGQDCGSKSRLREGNNLRRKDAMDLI